MPQLSRCPHCQQSVTIPDELSATVRVRCPWCENEYNLDSAAAEIAITTPAETGSLTESQTVTDTAPLEPLAAGPKEILVTPVELEAPSVTPVVEETPPVTPAVAVDEQAAAPPVIAVEEAPATSPVPAEEPEIVSAQAVDSPPADSATAEVDVPVEGLAVPVQPPIPTEAPATSPVPAAEPEIVSAQAVDSPPADSATAEVDVPVEGLAASVQPPIPTEAPADDGVPFAPPAEHESAEAHPTAEDHGFDMAALGIEGLTAAKFASATAEDAPASAEASHAASPAAETAVVDEAASALPRRAVLRQPRQQSSLAIIPIVLGGILGIVVAMYGMALLLGPEYNFFYQISGIRLPGTRIEGPAKPAAHPGASQASQADRQPSPAKDDGSRSAFPLQKFDDPPGSGPKK